MYKIFATTSSLLFLFYLVRGNFILFTLSAIVLYEVYKLVWGIIESDRKYKSQQHIHAEIIEEQKARIAKQSQD